MFHLPPWWDTVKHKAQRRRNRRSHGSEIFPPWSQSYLRMLRTERERRSRGCSSIFWGHIKVCSMGSHWPGVPQEVVSTFYYRHLKRCRSPRAPRWSPPPPFLFSWQRLLMTRMPYIILLIIIVGIAEKPRREWWGVDFIIMSAHQGGCRTHVSSSCWHEESLVITQRASGRLAVYVSCMLCNVMIMCCLICKFGWSWKGLKARG